MSRNIKKIPFARPSIGRKEIAAVKRVMKSGWLTTGAETIAFEREFAAQLNENPKNANTLNDTPIEAVSVNSATAGLHLALEALGISTGDLVAVPSLTFTASAEIIRYLGADPVFIDSDPETGNICPNALRLSCDEHQKKGRPISAVIPVHLAGRPCKINEVLSIADKFGLDVVEDAAHAFPSRLEDGMAGTFGDIGVFSFYATKTITTAEGGMAVTRNAKIADHMRLMRLHGIDRVVWNRYGPDAGLRSWVYDVTAPGFKYNLNDISSAIGRVQLRRADELFHERRRLAHEYRDSLSGISGLKLPEDTDGHAWHLFIIRLENRSSRNALADALFAAGIGVSVHFNALHRMTYWKERYQLKNDDYPVADDFSNRCLSLPLWPGLTRRQQFRIVQTVKDSL